MKYRSFQEKYGIEKIEAHWWKTIPEEEKNKRYEICKSCDKLKDVVCEACGCHIPSKIHGYYSECPLDKWEVFPHVI